MKTLIKEQENYILNLRRTLHQNPEVSWQEYETSKLIKTELDAIGIPYESLAGTGVIATIGIPSRGKTVALRADMDALAVTEKNTLDHASSNPGVMHACGHDGHTAMLLGAARVLKMLENDINGCIKLIFQPAEEMVEGAKTMIKAGAIDTVEGIFGIHLWSGLKIGKIACGNGPQMASGDYVVVDIEGKGGHGSLPHQGVDAIVALSSFLLNIQSMVSREIDPLDPAVLTFGEVKSGTRFNVLSSKAHVEGTVRCFNPEIRSKFPEIITRYGNNICDAHRATFHLNYTEGTPPTINDAHCAHLARLAASEFLDKSAIVDIDKTTGSEDMAYYLEKIPGAIAFVGAGNASKGCDFPHHHPKFNIDEDSLIIGMELYVRFALNFLNQ